MTKEPIMIDGVDVAGCNFMLERDGKIKCECTHATGFGVICDCESWKTCDYKNYKRKEQELNQYIQPIIDRLLKQFETYDKLKSLDVVTFAKQTFEQLDQLKAENDDLKKSILQECPNCGEEYLNYKGVELYDENNQLKQTLAEIKEIAQGYKPYKVCGDYNNNCEPINEILQKCGGALNE